MASNHSFSGFLHCVSKRFAGNLIRATFGEQHALVLLSRKELVFNLGFPYHLLDRETTEVKSIRDAFFMKTIASVKVQDVLSVADGANQEMAGTI